MADYENRMERHPVSDANQDNKHANDPLHGITLEMMLRKLVNKYDWPGLAKRIPLKCFKSDPSISSSLNFLRKNPWARKQVEELYLNSKFWTRDQ